MKHSFSCSHFLNPISNVELNIYILSPSVKLYVVIIMHTKNNSVCSIEILN